jgi:hypothetical protein
MSVSWDDFPVDPSITHADVDQAVSAIRSAFPGCFDEPESLVVCDFRDEGEGFKIVPHGMDPVEVSAVLNDGYPGMPERTYFEVSWGGLYLHRI